MVDFNKYRCRNCLHWHSSFTQKIEPYRCEVKLTDGSPYNGKRMCNCDNFESLDNLVYLEQKALDK